MPNAGLGGSPRCRCSLTQEPHDRASALRNGAVSHAVARLPERIAGDRDRRTAGRVEQADVVGCVVVRAGLVHDRPAARDAGPQALVARVVARIQPSSSAVCAGASGERVTSRSASAALMARGVPLSCGLARTAAEGSSRS